MSFCGFLGFSVRDSYAEDSVALWQLLLNQGVCSLRGIYCNERDDENVTSLAFKFAELDSNRKKTSPPNTSRITCFPDCTCSSHPPPSSIRISGVLYACAVIPHYIKGKQRSPYWKHSMIILVGRVFRREDNPRHPHATCPTAQRTCSRRRPLVWRERSVTVIKTRQAPQCEARRSRRKVQVLMLSYQSQNPRLPL